MKKALEFFTRTINKNRLSHLYLINGLRGVGKKQLIDEILFLLYKKEITDEEKLRKDIINKNLANVIYIEPIGNTVKKEQIIELQKNFSKTSLYNGPRVYVISDIEKLSSSAANSLLKFLEEPNQEVYGFLLTSNKESVIPTIISRSQLINLNDSINIEKNDNNEIDSFLLSIITKSQDEITSFLNDQNMIELVEAFKEFISIINDNKKSLIIDLKPKMRFVYVEKNMFEHFLNFLLIFYLDVIRYKNNQTPFFSLLIEDIKKQSNIDDIKIEETIDLIKDVLKKQRYYINLDLAIEYLLYNLDKRK